MADLKGVRAARASHRPPPRAPTKAPSLDLVRRGGHVVRAGMQGDSVTWLQQQLASHGALKGAHAAGTFDRPTTAAVRAFQASRSLKVDGLVGPKTLAALEQTHSTWAPSGPQRAPARSGSSPVAPRTQPAPQPPPVVASPPPPAEGPSTQLDPQRRTLVELARAGQLGATSQAALQGLMETPAVRQLDEAGTTQLLRGLDVTNPGPSLKGLQRFAQSPAFVGASPADREKLLGLAALGVGAQLEALQGVLGSKDRKGTRLLDSLHQLATAPLAPELEPQRAALLASTMDEAAHPEHLRQSGLNRCGATVAAIMLAQSSPAEYARLVAGLASERGATTLANGDSLTRVPGSMTGDARGHTPSERLLQSALMDYGDGALRYDAGRDVHLDSAGKPLRAGLQDDELSRVLTGVLGKRFAFNSVYQRGLLDKLGAPVSMAANLAENLLGWKYRRSGDELFDGLTAKKAPAQTMVALKWATRGHVVAVDHIADGRVYFRNPQGNQVAPGQTYPASAPPPRRAEDAQQMQSMTVGDFRERLLITIDSAA